MQLSARLAAVSLVPVDASDRDTPTHDNVERANTRRPAAFAKRVIDEAEQLDLPVHGVESARDVGVTFFAGGKASVRGAQGMFRAPGRGRRRPPLGS